MYSQFTAFKALLIASLRSLGKSPSAIFFSIAFPLIFILAFGFLGGGGISVNVGLAPNTDTTNPIYTALKNIEVVNLKIEDSATMHKKLSRGSYCAIIDIKKTNSPTPPFYTVSILNSSVTPNENMVLQQVLNTINYKIDSLQNSGFQKSVQIKQEIVQGREYKYIDFFLPGQLGFSLLASAIFGTAFVFFNLRQTLVFKRFFATPVKRHTIVLAEATSRLLLQIISAIIIIGIGHYVFGFTLIHGFSTFLQIIIVSIIALLAFMGFGFTISGIAKSDSTIPPLANMITMPQFLLSGVFFPIDNFPTWLQPICKVLPLTYFNHAVRSISFEGLNIWDVRTDIAMILLWGVLIYALASRVFKWE